MRLHGRQRLAPPGERESRGTSVYYRIADDSVYALCDLVCDNIAQQYDRAAKQQRAMFGHAAEKT